MTTRNISDCLNSCGVSSNLDHPEDLEDGEDAHQSLDVCEAPLLFLLLLYHLCPRPLKIHVCWQLWLVF